MSERHTSALTLPLADPAASLELVGGKGMSLAKLSAAGLPVPGGFHVTTTAYRRFVDANQLQPALERALAGADPADPAALEAAARQIAELFAAGQTPPSIEQAVAAAYAGLADAPVAVRSSATAEDLPGASFAGQQETYLNIQGSQALLAAVKRCWASLWTARAIAYRLNSQIDQRGVALAVVVQRLVAADAAGILFTANPVSGSRDELVINAAWGLGEAVVSGAVTPDTLTVAKSSGRLLRREIAEKAIMTVRDAQGTHEAPVPAAQRRQPTLTDAQAAELARLATRIEQLYGTPMDIEWTLAGGAFAIVQARPITALPPEWRLPEANALYSRGSLAEHTPSPVTPLFATLGLELANIATAQLWERLISKRAERLLPTGGAYLALNGYVYLGLRLTAANTLMVLRSSAANIGLLFRGSVERWQAASRELAAVVAAWEREPIAELAPSRLLAGVRAVFGAACRYFTEIQTTLPAAGTSELLFSQFYERSIRRAGDPPATTFLLGLRTIALRAEQSLFDLARWLRGQPELAAYLASTPSAQLVGELQQLDPPAGLAGAGWAELRARFARHLHEFGRSAYEFDFAVPTPQEAPGPQLDVLKAYVAGTAGDPYERERAASAAREAAERAVLARVGWPRRGWFLKLLRWAQATGPMREDSIFDLGMGHPLVRRMLGELGRRFVAGGALRQADEIYWLERNELVGLIEALERGMALPDLAGRIPARKAQWQAALKIVPPVMLPERTRWQRLIQGGDAETKDGQLVLKGVGTSGGRVTARACVLIGPEDFGKLQPGDVLVAVTTTPAWTPLFARAAAVVTDIGGPLSHSSIVAREYGIPAVMAARSATRAIQSGQIITVDGTSGLVTVRV